MEISASTGLLGIFGDPVAHSLSPAMQNAALRQSGIDAVYLAFHVRPEGLAAAVAAIRALGLRGVNLTIPHKEAVLPLLDEIDPAARMAGAVNTIVNRGGTLYGYNTDGAGLLRSLREDLDFDPAGRSIVILGAGGACRGALAALATAGVARLVVANRSPERAEQLVDAFAPLLPGTSLAACSLEPPELAPHLRKADLLLNSSAVGLKGESFEALPWQEMGPAAVVYDMVYLRHGRTALLTTAASRGHRIADGLGMLACQGEEAFVLWTGRRAPAGVMRACLQSECVAI